MRLVIDSNFFDVDVDRDKAFVVPTKSSGLVIKSSQVSPKWPSQKIIPVTTNTNSSS